MNEKELASYFDHTLLKPESTFEDFDRFIEEAIAIHPASVAVNPVITPYLKSKLDEHNIPICVAVGFPLGASTIEAKIFEAQDAIKLGAEEVDYVLNITEAKAHHWDYIDEELRRITEAVHEEGKIVKVILEICFLTDEEIVEVCKLAVKNHTDFVKTSTGFVKGENTGARVEIIKLMKETVGDQAKIKASGGIRDYATCLQMIEAGADRIGTSSSLKILEEFRAQENK